MTRVKTRKKRAREEEAGEGAGEGGPQKEAKTTVDVVRTVKLSLSKVMMGGKARFDLLQDVVKYCNQVRVVGTLIAKHHIFTVLANLSDEHKRELDALPFVPNQNYFSHCMTVARKKKIKDTEKMLAEGSYKEGLTKSAEVVLSKIPAPVYEGHVSGKAISQILSWFAKQLAENLSTHLTTHYEDVAQVWLKNEIRAEVLKETPKIEGKALKDAIKARRDAIKDNDEDPLSVAFDILESQLDAMASKGKIGEKTQKLIAAFYSLQRSAGDHEEKHETQFKLYSVVPEANIGIAPITICRRVMLGLYNAVYSKPPPPPPPTPKHSKKKATKPLEKAVPPRTDQFDDTNWRALFKMKEIDKLRNAPWEFAHTMMTDGVALWVRFEQEVPKKEYQEREAFIARNIDLTTPGLYNDQNTVKAAQLDNANLVAVDPGVAAIITAVRLSDVDRETLKVKEGAKPFVVKQAQYSEECLLRYKLKKTGTLKCKPGKKRGRKHHHGKQKRWLRRRKKERIRKSHATKNVLAKPNAVLQAAPSPKRVEIHKYEEYLNALASVWHALWGFHGTVKRRKEKFFVYRRRESFMNRVVNSFAKKFGPNPVVLFGNGADNGLFGRLRGGGVKGPVKELKRRLAEKYCVIGCSEFRSSKLCVHCGRELHVHKHGVVYCAQQSHHAMLNRDVTAAIKIGAIFLAKKKNIPLGPWAWGSKIEAEAPSNALITAIIGHVARTTHLPPMRGGC